MINVFRILFNISVSASILAAAVIVFRLIFRKAPKWIICLLWGLVGLRLIFPFSVESIIGLLPRSNVITESGAVNTGIATVDDGITNTAYSIAVAAAPVTHSAKTGMGTQAVLGEILFYIWLAGFIAMAVACAVSFIKIRLKVNQSVKLKDNICICDEIDTPFILGIFRPEIFIPSGIDEAKIHSIIAHEKSHIRRKDNWWKPLGFLLLSVYWFNPVMWAAYILLCRDIEFACDEKVIKNMSTDEVADYSQTLLDCSKPRRLVTVCPLSFGEVGVKQRIKSALSYKKPALWIIIVAVIASLIVSIAFTTKRNDNNNIGTKLVTIENGIYTFYSLENERLKFEKSSAAPGDTESLHSIIKLNTGIGNRVVYWNQTALITEKEPSRIIDGIYAEIYDSLPDKSVDYAYAYTDGKFYYVSTRKFTDNGITEDINGALYRYSAANGLKKIYEMPNGFAAQLYTEAQGNDTDSAIQYKVSDTVFTDVFTDYQNNNFELLISNGSVWRHSPVSNDNGWTPLGTYERFSLSDKNFNSLFRSDMENESEKTAAEIIKNNKEAYKLTYGAFTYYFLYQNDNGVLLAEVRGSGSDAFISDVFLLTPTEITFSSEYESLVKNAVLRNPPLNNHTYLRTAGVNILGIKRTQGATEIYAAVACKEYEFQRIDFENLYFVGTAWKVTPAVITVKEGSPFTTFKYPEEINKEESYFKGVLLPKLKTVFMFPKHIRDNPDYRFINQKALMEQCDKAAESYLISQNINAEIKNFDEMKYNYLSSYISTEALKETKENLGDNIHYPEFIGSREIILYDQVALFETRFDYETKHISFYAGTRQDNLVKKYEFDSKGWPIYRNPSSSFGDGEDLTHAVSTTAPYIPGGD